jgi:hypothetical protein
MARIRNQIQRVGLRLFRLLGMTLLDYRTGKVIGRAFLLPWRGKIHVIGLETAVRAVFLPQKRLTYWKQEIGFTTQPPPDYSNERSTSSAQRDQRESN